MHVNGSPPRWSDACSTTCSTTTAPTARITRLVNENELWFIPVANPDGYDFSFEDGQRLQRKNMRDNNGDGTFTPGEGVDLNRNSATRWGYDNEGSSPNPNSDTYRGPSPASEPETQALDNLFRRITPEFFINYHSAAELLLYGLGWQVATPSPDDVLYAAMAGDDANPAVPGYDPDISAELYTTNGDIDTHMQAAYGTLGFTPEMSTCEAASAIDPDDSWLPENCESGFHFPDDEALIQQEFEKNIPFALAVAKSAKDPDDPVSVVGIDTPNFVVDSFDVSYGDPQQVAVTVKRAINDVKMNYRINGGRVRSSTAHAHGAAASATGSRTPITTSNAAASCGAPTPVTPSRCGSPARTPIRGSAIDASTVSTSRTRSPRTRATTCW